MNKITQDNTKIKPFNNTERIINSLKKIHENGKSLNDLPIRILTSFHIFLAVDAVGSA